jgi:uncharacterized coiled-coil protein SlyX
MSSTTRKINWPALIGSILGIVLVGTLLFFGLRYTQTNDQAVAALDTRITAAEQTNSTQQTAIDSLVTLEANNNTAQQGQIDSLAGRIGTAEGEIDAIQANDATQNSAITDLQTGLAGTQNDVGALQDDLTDVISSTADLESRLAALEANSTAATTSTLQLTTPVTTTSVSGLTVTVGSTPTMSGTTAISGTTATTGTLTSGAGSALNGAVTISDTTGLVFTATGINQNVDPATVDVAKGTFVNTIGEGSQGWLAEPGVVMIDYPVCSANADIAAFTDPVLKAWAERVRDANGAMGCTNPSNQTLFSTQEAYVNLPEGGFVVATVNGSTMEIGDMTITMEGRPAHNWLIVVRGQYGDMQRDSDRNQTIRFSDYVPGHGLATRYPLGGFVSENHFLQLATASASAFNTNCGDGGCSQLSVLFVDVNTGAMSVMTRTAPDQPFTNVYRNW